MFDGVYPSWTMALAVFVAVALGVVCMSLLWEGVRRLRQRRDVSRRLEQLSRGGPVPGSDPDRAPLLRPGEEEGPAWLQSLVTVLPHREDLQRLLQQADSEWSVGTYLLLTVGLGLAAGVSASLVFPGAAGPLLAVAGGGALPYVHLRRRRTKRYRAFEENFPETIELLGRSLRAGHAFLTGLEVVAEESPPPVNAEFRQVFEEQRFGLPLNESLLGLADRIDSVDVRMFVTSVMIQRESGGNLAEILDNLANLIRERFKFRRQLRVHTAQGRMTGYLLAVLPVAVALILFAIDRDYMIVLFVEPMGKTVLLFTLVLQVLGFLWIRKIVSLEF